VSRERDGASNSTRGSPRCPRATESSALLFSRSDPLKIDADELAYIVAYKRRDRDGVHGSVCLGTHGADGALGEGLCIDEAHRVSVGHRCARCALDVDGCAIFAGNVSIEGSYDITGSGVARLYEYEHETPPHPRDHGGDAGRHGRHAVEVLALGSTANDVLALETGGVALIKAGRRPSRCYHGRDGPRACDGELEFVVAVGKPFDDPRAPGLLLLNGFGLAHAWLTVSDGRTKRDVRPYPESDAVDVVLGVGVYAYRLTREWIESSGAEDVLYHGFLAEEVQRVLPSAAKVVHDERLLGCDGCDDGRLAVSAERMLPELWMAARRLIELVDALSLRVRDLEIRLNTTDTAP